MVRSSPFPNLLSSLFLYDEQHWSVLPSGLKNRHMTITKAFKCASEYPLPFSPVIVIYIELTRLMVR
jgi:hypothetical protein